MPKIIVQVHSKRQTKVREHTACLTEEKKKEAHTAICVLLSVLLFCICDVLKLNLNPDWQLDSPIGSQRQKTHFKYSI